MKRFLIALLCMMLVLSLVACVGGGESEVSGSASESASETESEGGSAVSDEKSGSAEESDEESDEESNEDESSEESVDNTVYGDSGLVIKYASYSEKPYFAVVGTCDEGAVVSAVTDEGVISSQSYHGWFSLRLKCSGSSVKVAMYQTVDGVESEKEKFSLKPITPGSDMWPIVTGGDYQFFFQKMLPDYQCTNVPSSGNLSQLTNRIKSRLNALSTSSPDTEIIYMIVPSSMTVYPELVPEKYKQGTGKSRLDAVIGAIEAGGATAIDLRDAFAEHKNEEMPLYYKLDSHWAEYGAFVAYTELFDHISQKFPAAAPRALDEFTWEGKFFSSGDMTYYLAMSQSAVPEYSYYRTANFDMPSEISSIPRYRATNSLVYSNQVTYEYTIDTNRSNLPSCIVMRDSYSTQLFDILAERMDTTVYKGMWGYTWNQQEISSMKPDYVIYILAEWNIDSVLYN